jgi:hypothetical protein
MLILGILIMLAGINMFIMYAIMGMMGSSTSEFYTYISIAFIFLGLVCILIAQKIPSRFLIGSIFCFISAGTCLVIWRTFLPRMKEMSDEFREAEATSAESGGGAISVFNPQDVSFGFYNNMFIFLIIAFIIIGIILIIIYKKQENLFGAKKTIS